MYIPYTDLNQVSCVFFGKDGNYKGSDGGRFAAVATFLNNGNWEFTDEEIKVIKPYNTDEIITLNKQKNKIYELYQQVIENTVKRILKEGILDDFDTYTDEDEKEELEPFEEYEKDYPNGDFDVSDMTPDKLAKWCQNVGDFLYVYKGLRGLSIMCANVDNIVASIVSDLYNCRSIEPTHEVDYLFYSREREFIYDYVCIFKVIGTPDGDYYVVYQEDKSRGRHPSIQENKNHINEAFKSNQLRQWFKEHGGVKNRYNDEKHSNLIDKRVMQDGLGDVSDDAILYTEEFNDYNEALNKKWQLKRSNPNTRQKSDWDMKAYFTVYQANDGICLLVGLDRSKIKTGSTWGGELTKKTADRVMNNGWNFKTRSNRYVDDSDT